MTGTVRDFLMPDLGEGLTEGEIIAWLVAEGDTVTVDQPIAEMATEKATVEVPVPFAGRVATLHGAVGDVVKVGRPLISIEVTAVAAGERPGTSPATEPVVAADAAGEATGGAARGAEASGSVLVGYGTTEGPRVRRRRVVSEPAAPADIRPSPPPVRVLEPAQPAPAATGGAAGGGPVPVPSSPLVRRLAAELGVELAQVHGTGPMGAVSRADLEGHAADRRAAAALPGVAATGRQSLSRIRRITAERLARSHAEAPVAHAWVTVDASRLLAWRDLLARRHPEQRITPFALVLTLTARALERYPLLNAAWDAERSEVVLHDAVHLGIAAQTDAGLVVPVLRDAHRRTAVDIAAEVERLATSARAGRVDGADSGGSTFTVSNIGAFGVDGGTAIINPPEAAILAVGRITERPAVVDGQVVPRAQVELSVTFDHRVCDGRDGGGFTRLLGDWVANPELALGE